MSSVMGSTIQRRRILVRGIVQGVGFRPFVYGQALRCGLVGFVYNDSLGVTIEVEGSIVSLDSFQRAFSEQLPPLARIDSISTELIPPCFGERFEITQSQKGLESQALISADSATCDDCLHELCDPGDRRYQYAFINCTNCGPRFTIVQDVPYDRKKTTMQVFPMCPICQKEYSDPLDRRFHAQPNACPSCGPMVHLLDGSGKELPDPINTAARKLARGAIVAIKGLGGYHLACDASHEGAVEQLRQRKHREARPFALMVPDIKTARLFCKVSETEGDLLQSRRRPIVLLERQGDYSVASGVAPSYDSLGLMLPYTPLHYLLLQALGLIRDVDRQPIALVMTSGNFSDEPIAYLDEDASERLASIADFILTHDRVIHMRCDDSVVQVVAGGEQFFRRSRGYTPEPLTLSFDLPEALLACGGHLKNTFCLGKGRQAFVSHHIGNLENMETLTSFREGIEHYQRLFDVYPQAIAYDLHPEYLATKYALDSPISQKIGVQHHHAHIASVLAEHGLSGPVIGIAADGTGFGTDGAVWGCEIMVADLVDFTRLTHLAYVPLPGGEQAVRQPWRMAAVYLARTYGEAFLELDIPFVYQLDRAKWRPLSQMIARNINSPATSSLGRLFDAVAALIGLRGEVVYEGQAAIELEMLARSEHSERGREAVEEPYPFSLSSALGDDGVSAVLNMNLMIEAIVNDLQQGLPSSRIARRFHTTIAGLLASASLEARKQTGLTSVALSGGVFQNRLLLETLIERLEAMDFQVYSNRRVPPNDGGLSLGQLAVAAARLQRV